MAVDLDRLRTFVNAGAENDDELNECLAVAAVLVTSHLGVAITDVPPVVLDRVTLLVAAEMFNQGRAPNGILNQQFDEAVGFTRVGSDPLRPAYALLAQYIPPRVS